MADETKVCIDCNDEFIFTERDQEFFTEKGYTPPKRCKTCVQKKKARNRDRQDI